MTDEDNVACAIPVAAASAFVGAVAALTARLPATIAAQCSSLTDALDGESLWADLLDDVPLLLIVGDEPSVAGVVFESIFGARVTPPDGDVVLISHSASGRGSRHDDPTIRHWPPPENATFGMQVVYVADYPAFALRYPRKARALLLWSCVVAAISPDIPEWLRRSDATAVLLWSNPTTGQVTARRADDRATHGRHTDVHGGQLLGHVMAQMDVSAWPTNVLRLFRRLAEPINEARDVMAWERRQTAKRARTIEQALSVAREHAVSRVQGWIEVLADAVPQAIVLASSAAWSEMMPQAQRTVAVEKRKVAVPDSQKSSFHRLLEWVVGEVRRTERFERVSYRVSGKVVQEFKRILRERVEVENPWSAEVTPTPAEVEAEVAARLSASVGSECLAAVGPRASVEEELNRRLGSCRDSTHRAAIEWVAELPSRSMRFSETEVRGGLARVVTERLRDAPIRGVPQSNAGDVTEAWTRWMAPRLAQVQTAEDHLLDLEKEARNLVDISGTLELAAQEDLNSGIARIRRAVRASLDREGRGTRKLASGFARLLARVLRD